MADNQELGRAFEEARSSFQKVDRNLREIESCEGQCRRIMEDEDYTDERIESEIQKFRQQEGYDALLQTRQEAATKYLEAGRDYIAGINPKFYEAVRANLDAAIAGNGFSRHRILALLSEIKVDVPVQESRAAYIAGANRAMGEDDYMRPEP